MTEGGRQMTARPRDQTSEVGDGGQKSVKEAGCLELGACGKEQDQMAEAEGGAVLEEYFF